jgi:hypothetical protein
MEDHGRDHSQLVIVPSSSWKIMEEITANLSLCLPFPGGAMEDHGQCVLKVSSDHTTTGVCVQIDCVPCPDPQSFAATN